MRNPILKFVLNYMVCSLLLAVNAVGRVHAENIVFPADAGVRNIQTEFGAKGDGVTDDTPAFQRAFDACMQKHMEIVYLPNGTYLLSHAAWFRGWLFLQGQSREGTIIRLRDNCPGYQDAKNPSWMLGTTEPMPPAKRPGGDNMAFSNHLMNLTLDTGKGNPGAIALQFISNNGGGLEEVTLRSGDSGGPIGLDIRTPWNGPCFFKNIAVQGFDVGIETWNDTYFSTFENVRLQGQRVAGWRNRRHPLSVRHLISVNRVPAFVNEEDAGQLVLLDSDLRGGNGDACAIENRAGRVFLRGIRTMGYRSALREGATVVAGANVTEFISGDATMLFPSVKHSLGLPIRETPEISWEPLANWVSVLSFHPKRITLWCGDHNETGYDAAIALQQAIDSGKTTVYLPHGNYFLRSQVIVRGKVRVIQGCGSMVTADGEMLKGKPAIRIERTVSGGVFLDRLSMPVRGGMPSVTYLEHAGATTLVVLHSRWMSFRNAPGCGMLFVEDMPGGPWQFHYPQKAWIRMLNVEMGEGIKVSNQAADLWLMGYKSEGRATDIANGRQARTELLGGILYPAGGDPEKFPSFINMGGSLALTHTMFWANNNYITDRRNGEEKRLRLNPGTRFMSLYVSRPIDGKP